MDNANEQNASQQQQLDELLNELKSAQDAFSQWEDNDMRRADGSGAQDKRNEVRGESLRARVQAAQQKVAEQKKLIEAR